MAEPFLSEIRVMSFAFAPRGWATCDGQILPINQNQGLFSLLGTTFGGDGRVNFALPDLRGRVPIHVSSGYTLGQLGGEQTHTLTIGEVPEHVHVLSGTSNSSDPNGTNNPATNLLAAGPGEMYGAAANLQAMAPSSVGTTGGPQPGPQAHPNMQPYLTLNFSIALQGIFPSPT